MWTIFKAIIRTSTTIQISNKWRITRKKPWIVSFPNEVVQLTEQAPQWTISNSLVANFTLEIASYNSLLIIQYLMRPWVALKNDLNILERKHSKKLNISRENSRSNSLLKLVSESLQAKLRLRNRTNLGYKIAMMSWKEGFIRLKTFLGI